MRLMVCHTQRYAAPLIQARRMIASGEVRPRAMVSRYLLDKRENVSWTGRRRSWTDNLLWHHGCHAVDAALWLLGRKRRMSPRGRRLRMRGSGSRWIWGSCCGRRVIKS